MSTEQRNPQMSKREEDRQPTAMANTIIGAISAIVSYFANHSARLQFNFEHTPSSIATSDEAQLNEIFGDMDFFDEGLNFVALYHKYLQGMAVARLRHFHPNMGLDEIRLRLPKQPCEAQVTHVRNSF